MPDHFKLLDSDEVAQILGVRRTTLEAWRCRGEGPAFIRVGRLPRYRPEALDAYLQARTQSPGTAAS